MADARDRIQVAFDATLQDLIDVILAARAPEARRDARLFALTAVLSAGATLVQTGRDDLLTGLGFAAFAGAIVLGLGVLKRAAVRQRTRAECRARLQGRESFLVEVEVAPEGVRVRSLGDDIAVGWKDVTAVKAAGEPVDIWVRGHHLIRVQARAFGSGMDREMFVELVRRYAGLSSGPPTV